MKDLTKDFLELIRLAATNLPPDVEIKLRLAFEAEEDGSAAKGALETILKNVELAREKSTPICQDTGTPIFYIHYPEGWSGSSIRWDIHGIVRWWRGNPPFGIHGQSGKCRYTNTDSTVHR